MPPSDDKEKTRCIYIVALVISFLLIVGSIVLHLRQKTHLGRMSFNFDRDRIKPTSGVEAVTWMDDDETAAEPFAVNYEAEEENHTFEETLSKENDLTAYDTSSKELKSNEKIRENSGEGSNGNISEDVEVNIDQMIDEFNESIDADLEYELKMLEQDTCLRCLCMTVNECRPTFCGSGNPCGLYRISKSYWVDGGRPTISGGSTDNEDQDYLTCVNEDNCSATVIRNYYERYKRDCNKDGVFDCRDQIALHILGPNGCLTKNLSYIHAIRMRKCLIESNMDYISYSTEEDSEPLVK